MLHFTKHHSLHPFRESIRPVWSVRITAVLLYQHRMICKYSQTHRDRTVLFSPLLTTNLNILEYTEVQGCYLAPYLMAPAQLAD